jgi:ribonuclease BN (tRNA processing enzyme)
MAGPLADPTRAQPATLLRWQGGMVLVDAGDGAAGQLAKAGGLSQ